MSAPESASPWFTRGQRVHVFAQAALEREWVGIVLVIDLWTERSGRDLPTEIQQAERALEIVRRQLASLLEAPAHNPWAVEKQEEFIELKLPRSIAPRLPTERARAAISAHRSHSRYEPGEKLPTVQIVGDRLALGPEYPGTVDAVRTYLEQEVGVREGPVDSDRHRRWFWIPILMAVSMLLTWALPLRLWSLALVAAVLLGLVIVALLPARKVGWRPWLGQAPVVASLGFFGIGTFGIGYGICALINIEALGPVPALGYVFLVSTGLGVAGGILGDNPKGAARVLAHIQLLLFLGGMAGVAALLLRIARNTKPGE